jgi:hypothetical protein
MMRPCTSPTRLAALHRLALLDTVAEPAFDRLTRLACTLLGVPIALVSLVDADRQFFKAAHRCCRDHELLFDHQ